MNLKYIVAAVLLLAAVVATGPAAAQVRCDTTCIHNKVNQHLQLMGEFNDDEALTASLRGLIAIGTPVVRVVQDTYSTWLRTEEPDPLGGTARRCPDISKLARLGYKQRVPLSEGLKPTLDWYWRNAGLAPKA